MLLGLSNVSEAMSKGALTEAQEWEKFEIIAEASDFVSGRRPEERSLPAEQVKIQQFDRLKDLLKKVQAVDATFDRTLLGTVIIHSEMSPLTTDDLARLQDIVGDGSIKVNEWIAGAQDEIRTVRLDLSEIKQAIKDLAAARLKLNQARADCNQDEACRLRYSRAQLGVEYAETRLRDAIRLETKRLSRHAYDVGWLERRIIAAFATSPHQQDDIRAAIKDLLFPALGGMSDLLKVRKVENQPLSVSEDLEKYSLVADACGDLLRRVRGGRS